MKRKGVNILVVIGVLILITIVIGLMSLKSYSRPAAVFCVVMYAMGVAPLSVCVVLWFFAKRGDIVCGRCSISRTHMKPGMKLVTAYYRRRVRRNKAQIVAVSVICLMLLGTGIWRSSTLFNNTTRAEQLQEQTEVVRE